MPLPIDTPAPDFVAQSTMGPIRFHDWVGNHWCMLLSHPKDFTPVCTSELGIVARLKHSFDRRGVKIIGMSVDTIEDHAVWVEDIRTATGYALNYPLIADPDLRISKLYGMLPIDTRGTTVDRNARDTAAARTLFVIGPDKMIRLSLSYPLTTGRDFHEIIRVIDSLQLTERNRVATPANWVQGEDVLLLPSISDAEAQERFAYVWEAPVPYFRVAASPDATF
ncbi:MAG: peroxiredoxin [Pseudomonadota bacterium]